MQFLKKKTRKGSVIQSLVQVCAIPIVIILMITLYANFHTAIPTDSLDANATAAIDTASEQAYSAFNMASILPIALIGITILVLIVGALSRIG